MFSILLCTSAAVSQRGMSDKEGAGMGIGPGDCRPISGMGTPDRAFALRPQLARRVEKLTGEPSAEKACRPIGDVGECLITAHASQILKVKFDCLRSDIVGGVPLSSSHCPAGTGQKKTDLKEAIAKLAPQSDAAAVVKEATQQTRREVCLP
jgi:hypothetical protein